MELYTISIEEERKKKMMMKEETYADTAATSEVKRTRPWASILTRGMNEVVDGYR